MAGKGCREGEGEGTLCERRFENMSGRYVTENSFIRDTKINNHTNNNL